MGVDIVVCALVGLEKRSCNVGSWEDLVRAGSCGFNVRTSNIATRAHKYVQSSGHMDAP